MKTLVYDAKKHVRKKRGHPAARWIDSVTLMMSAQLEDLKDQIRGRSS